MRLPFLALILPLLLAMSAAQAQEIPNFESIGTVQGKCGKLLVSGRDRSAQCRPAIAVLKYRSGRMSFAFSGEDIMISFSGTREKSAGDRAELILDAVTVASHAKGGEVATEAWPATGSCRFSNPWAGRSYIRCSATTSSGDFSGEFDSNGNPPDIQKF